MAAEQKPEATEAPRRTKRIHDTRAFLSEVVGEEALRGQRMQAGVVLDLIDILGGRIAVTHSESRVATVSFDKISFLHPILHGDLVRLDGQLVSVGNSSMVVEIRVYTHDMMTREFIPTQHCFVTFVAIDEKMRPNKNIPKLEYGDTNEEAGIKERIAMRTKLHAELTGLQKAIDDREALTVADVEDMEVRRSKREFVTIRDTEVITRRQFFPRHENHNKSIFGGDLLLWMDKLATYTARRFTKNANVITISMDKIAFTQPILSTDLVEAVSRVVYVRNFTCVVDISVKLLRMNGDILASHTGSFTVLNYDESGFKRKIMTGLSLETASREELQAYAKARARFDHWSQHRDSYLPADFNAPWPHIAVPLLRDLYEARKAGQTVNVPSLPAPAKKAEEAKPTAAAAQAP